MSNKAETNYVRLALCWTAIAAPTIGIIVFTYFLNLYVATDRLKLIASLVSERSAKTSHQVYTVFTELARIPKAEACSAASISAMRQMAVKSSFLQGVGFISDNNLVCSSFGNDIGPIPVGKPDYKSKMKVYHRHHRLLSLAPTTPLLLSTSEAGFTALIHPDLVMDLSAPEQNYSLGVVGFSSKVILMKTGGFAGDWSRLPPIPNDQYSGTVISDGYMVVWHRPVPFDLLAYAAIPMAAIQRNLLDLLAWFVPVGLMCSLMVGILLHKITAMRGSLPALLRAGLRRKELFLVYQPIVEMTTGEWIGAEALIRWQRPGGEMVAPDIFIPIAEKNGLMPKITRFVIEQSLVEFEPLIRGPNHFFLSLNFSSQELNSPDMLKLLARCAAAHGVDPGRIHIELTEREQIQENDEITAIRSLRQMGFKVGTDDFGAGYSNLAYFDRLELDFIKLDKSLTRFARQADAGLEIVEHVIELAHSRQIDIIAEGIETERQRSLLIDRKVTWGQGWLFARPMRIADFITMKSDDKARPEEPVKVPDMASA